MGKVSRGFKYIKIELIKEHKSDRNIACSFNSGKFGTDIKWISIEEASEMLESLRDIVESHG